MKLHGYFRSSASYRVRIALNLKGLSADHLPHHLRKGEQRDPAYLAINPQGLVPTLQDDHGAIITQSLAIIEYLEEMYPEPALLPTDAAGRARVRALGQTIACEIHPLNNLRVLQYLEHELKMDMTARANWYRHWITLGFTALEAMLDNSLSTGAFCHGEQPTLADCCLIPQVANARRFDTPLVAFPHIARIEAACMALSAFQRAAPQAQPDDETPAS